MARWKIDSFNSSNEAAFFLNGDLVGEANLYSGAAVDGLTLVVDVGSGDKTVTFAPALSRAWTLTEILAAINAVVSNLAAATSPSEGAQQLGNLDRRLRLVNPGSLTVKSTGTANTLLGFSAVANTVSDPVTTGELQATELNSDNGSWSFITYR